MAESHSPPKDVADILDALAIRLREDPSYLAAEARSDPAGGLTIYAVPESAADGPVLGAVDLLADEDAITVTAETRNADPASVHVTLADGTLSIGLGEGQRALRRDVPLPSAVDEERAVATLRNGVLDIVLPLRRARGA